MPGESILTITKINDYKAIDTENNVQPVNIDLKAIRNFNEARQLLDQLFSNDEENTECGGSSNEKIQRRYSFLLYFFTNVTLFSNFKIRF